MFLTMAAGFAEMERNLIAERTRLAFARKHERGERVSARLPYGVVVGEDGKTLVPSARDKQLIARIKRLHCSGMSAVVMDFLLHAGKVERLCKTSLPTAAR